MKRGKNKNIWLLSWSCNNVSKSRSYNKSAPSVTKHNIRIRCSHRTRKQKYFQILILTDLNHDLLEKSTTFSHLFLHLMTENCLWWGQVNVRYPISFQFCLSIPQFYPATYFLCKLWQELLVEKFPDEMIFPF